MLVDWKIYFSSRKNRIHKPISGVYKFIIKRRLMRSSKRMLVNKYQPNTPTFISGYRRWLMLKR
jgi:hypothetical protein